MEHQISQILPPQLLTRKNGIQIRICGPLFQLSTGWKSIFQP